MEDEGTGYQNAGYDVDREDVYEDLCVSNRNSQMWQVANEAIALFMHFSDACCWIRAMNLSAC